MYLLIETTSAFQTLTHFCIGFSKKYALSEGGWVSAFFAGEGGKWSKSRKCVVYCICQGKSNELLGKFIFCLQSQSYSGTVEIRLFVTFDCCVRWAVLETASMYLQKYIYGVRASTNYKWPEWRNGQLTTYDERIEVKLRCSTMKMVFM